MTLNVNIAGYGILGKRRKLCVDLHPYMKIKAIYGKTFDNTNYDAEGITIYQTYKEILNNNIDIPIVYMTNDIAAEVTIAGLEKGLHIFCEKPPSRNVSDIKNVII
jgi:predicted dehydrogenase